MESSRLRIEPPRPAEGTPEGEAPHIDLVILPVEDDDDAPAPAEQVRTRSGVRPTCPYCRVAVERAEAKVACGDCLAWLHTECLAEHGACAACGSVAVLRPGLPAPGPDPAIRIRRRAAAVPRRPCRECSTPFEVVHHLPDRMVCGSCATKAQLRAFFWLGIALTVIVIMLGLAT